MLPLHSFPGFSCNLFLFDSLPLHLHLHSSVLIQRLRIRYCTRRLRELVLQTHRSPSLWRQSCRLSSGTKLLSSTPRLRLLLETMKLSPKRFKPRWHRMTSKSDSLTNGPPLIITDTQKIHLHTSLTSRTIAHEVSISLLVPHFHSQRLSLLSFCSVSSPVVAVNLSSYHDWSWARYFTDTYTSSSVLAQVSQGEWKKDEEEIRYKRRSQVTWNINWDDMAFRGEDAIYEVSLKQIFLLFFSI